MLRVTLFHYLKDLGLEGKLAFDIENLFPFYVNFPHIFSHLVSNAGC